MANEQIKAARQLIISTRPVASWTHEEIDALDALCAAARENVVMRELCEADDAHDKGAPAKYYPPLLMRLEAARAAYRAMKETTNP